MLQNHIEFESTSHVMSRDYCDWATAKVNCRRKLKNWTAEANCKSELQSELQSELKSEPQSDLQSELQS